MFECSFPYFAHESLSKMSRSRDTPSHGNVDTCSQITFKMSHRILMGPAPAQISHNTRSISLDAVPVEKDFYHRGWATPLKNVSDCSQKAPRFITRSKGWKPGKDQNESSFSHLGKLFNIFSGWWLSHPSEKYESQLGWLFQIYGKIKNVPNHQSETIKNIQKSSQPTHKRHKFTPHREISSRQAGASSHQFAGELGLSWRWVLHGHHMEGP